MQKITDKHIEMALRATGGMVSKAARRLNCTNSTIYRRMKESEYLQDVFTDIREETLDLTEAELIKKIKAGNLGAICFYLKCKGQGRGYFETRKNEHEITTPGSDSGKWEIEVTHVDAKSTKNKNEDNE